MWKDLNSLMQEEPLQLIRVLVTCLNAFRSWHISCRDLWNKSKHPSPFSQIELISDQEKKKIVNNIEWELLKIITKFNQETGNDLPIVKDRWNLYTSVIGLTTLAEGYEWRLLDSMVVVPSLEDYVSSHWDTITPYDATFGVKDIQTALALLKLSP